MAIDTKKLDAIIEELRGSCEGASHIFDTLTIEECQYIDAEIVECPNCGWWVETGNMYDEDYCNECIEQEYEDEDEE